MEMEIHIFRNPDRGFLSVPMPEGSTREAALSLLSGGVWPLKDNPDDVAASMNPGEIDVFNIDRHGKVDDPRYSAEQFDAWPYYGVISTTKISGFGGY